MKRPTRERPARWPGPALSCALWAGAFAFASLGAAAAAHPSSAEPPVFHDGACITVVDRQTQPSWHIDYEVPVEDTAADPDLVELPDTKTHQFYAVAAHVFARAAKYELLRFDAPLEAAQELPLWLSQADLMRVRSAGADHPTALANIPADAAVLEDDSALSELFHPISKDRVPITMIQGLRGLAWDVTQVPPGTYQILGYIFSPPYNDWAVRPGFVKVVDGSDDAPVLWLDDVAARLFAGQGKHVTGCADAPEGSTLSVAARPATDATAAYETLVTAVPIADGRFDACVLNQGRDASLTLKVTLSTPSGVTLSAFSVETLDMFSTKAGCTADERMCCDPSASRDSPATTGAPEAGAAAPSLARPAQPLAAGAGGPDAQPTAGMADASTEPDAGARRAATAVAGSVAQQDDPDDEATQPAAAQPGGACTVALGPRRGTAHGWQLGLIGLLTLVGLRARGGARHDCKRRAAPRCAKCRHPPFNHASPREKHERRAAPGTARQTRAPRG